MISDSGLSDEKASVHILNCRSVTCGPPDRPILKNLDLTVRSPGIYGILGASGTGKSTFLRLINRLDDHEGGHIELFGRDLRSYPVPELRKTVGMVFQKPVYIPGTVRGNLTFLEEFGGKVHSAPELQDLLERVNLNSSYLDRDVSVLSGGELQRLAVARSLLNSPKILLLDEPTSSLDRKNRDDILRMLGVMQKEQNITLIIVTHDARDLDILGSKCYYLENGRFGEQGCEGKEGAHGIL